jgi:hypothetical protein
MRIRIMIKPAIMFIDVKVELISSNKIKINQNNNVNEIFGYTLE